MLCQLSPYGSISARLLPASAAAHKINADFKRDMEIVTYPRVVLAGPCLKNSSREHVPPDAPRLE